MKVLFATFAAKSHLHAQVPLAWALQTAGHEVVIASQPDLAEEITKTGLTAVCVGEPLNLDQWFAEHESGTPNEWESDGTASDAAPLLDMSVTDLDELTWDRVQGTFYAMTNYVFQYEQSPAMVDDLVAFAKHWKPDLVIWDTMTFAGGIAAKACGAAHARLLFAIDLVGNFRARFLSFPESATDDPLREWLQTHLDRHGLTFDESLTTGNFTIHHVPPSMQSDTGLHYVPVRYIPYNGQAQIPSWLHSLPGKRRVCLTLGVAKRETRGHDFASVADLLESLSDVNAEIVATLNAAQLAALPALPENVRAVDFVPLKALLPTCSAIIHHGGSGTFQTALAYGVPQLIVPDLVWDTINKAEALEASGAGLYVRDVEKLSGGELRDSLVRLLDEPSFAANAARVQREIVGTPAPNSIIPLLEKLTTEVKR